jgi:hypothetical protein
MSEREPGTTQGQAQREHSGPATSVSAPATITPLTRRRRAKLGLIRIAGTLGIVGVATAIAAVLGTQDVDGWIVGLVASVVSVAPSAALWRWLRSEAAGTAR